MQKKYVFNNYRHIYHIYLYSILNSWTIEQLNNWTTVQLRGIKREKFKGFYQGWRYAKIVIAASGANDWGRSCKRVEGKAASGLRVKEQAGWGRSCKPGSCLRVKQWADYDWGEAVIGKSYYFRKVFDKTYVEIMQSNWMIVQLVRIIFYKT